MVVLMPPVLGSRCFYLVDDLNTGIGILRRVSIVRSSRICQAGAVNRNGLTARQPVVAYGSFRLLQVIGAVAEALDGNLARFDFHTGFACYGGAVVAAIHSVCHLYQFDFVSAGFGVIQLKLRAGQDG